jgi:hypothetical protein
MQAHQRSVVAVRRKSMASSLILAALGTDKNGVDGRDHSGQSRREHAAYFATKNGGVAVVAERQRTSPRGSSGLSRGCLQCSEEAKKDRCGLIHTAFAKVSPEV